MNVYSPQQKPTGKTECHPKECAAGGCTNDVNRGCCKFSLSPIDHGSDGSHH
jgi:hypothetical protein